MSDSRLVRVVVSGILVVLLTAACGLQPDSGSENGKDFEPTKPEFLVHTGPGGGSDLFVRDVIAMMRKEKLIETNWPVRNEKAGEGAGAMSYLMGKKGDTDTISAMTTTWITTPLTIEGASVTTKDLTAVAGLINEPEIMAVPADSPYDSLSDFIEDAKKKPGKLVQTGGSTTEVGALNGAALQAETDTKWKFLSFEEVGQRVTALLNGDADMMFGAATDFASQVKAGKLKVIGTISPTPSPLYPDAPTTEDEGYETELVAQVRGIMAPPGMPKEAVTYYQELFTKLLETKAWKDYAKKNGLVTKLLTGKKWEKYLAEQNALVKETLKTADLGKG
ncbi:MAG: hypothetical protein GEV07_29510 [Streptosporangiales bacterium]|nr:hypothetical protein [Streptosporangiales bacterium]